MRIAYERNYKKHASNHYISRLLFVFYHHNAMDLSFDNSEFNERYAVPHSNPKRSHRRRSKSDLLRRDALHNAQAARFRAGQDAFKRTRPSSTHSIANVSFGDMQIPAYIPLHHHQYNTYPVYFADDPVDTQEDERESQKTYHVLFGRNIHPSATYAIIDIPYGDATTFVYAPQYFRNHTHYPVYCNDNPINPDEDQDECNQVHEEVLG